MSPWIPGYAWKNDKFYCFDQASVLVLRLWPEMRAWRRTRTKPWNPTRKWADKLLCGVPLAPGRLEQLQVLKSDFVGPHPELLARSDFFRSSEICLSAFGSIPTREREIAAKFVDRRWHVLAMMARCPGATDLLQANPALGFALASHWILRKPAVKQPMRAARALLKRPQSAILEWLGFDPSERVRRILKRIAPSALEARRLSQMQAALNRPEVQSLLAHLPLISKDVLRFICFDETCGRVTASFLHELSSEAERRRLDPLIPPFRIDEPERFHLYLDARRMALEMGREIPAQLRSTKHLERWHDEMAEVLNRANDAGAEQMRSVIRKLNFGPPPLPGTSDIQALETGDELIAEGQVMGHCVASYYSDILSGRYFVYRVTSPIRATLGLRFESGTWQVDQIKGEGNRQISTIAEEEVWLRLNGAAP